MKKELDERFKIINVKDKNEYLEKIDLFLNQYEKLKPENKDRGLLSSLLYVNRKLFEKYGLIILDIDYFSKGQLDSNQYNFYIAYSNVLNKKVILGQRKNYYNSPLFLLDADNTKVTLSMLKRLYRVLVENVIDHAYLLREIKINKDKAFKICNFNYHYNPTQNKGMKFENVKYDVYSNCFTITYSSFNIKDNIQFYYSNYVNGYSCIKPNMLVKMYDNFVHSNDFKNDIKPLILKNIENNIGRMTNKNEEVLNKI